MRLLLTLSFAIAFAALFYPFFLGPFFFDSEMDSATHVSLFLALCWLVVFAVGIFKLRMRGLWLVIGVVGREKIGKEFPVFEDGIDGIAEEPGGAAKRAHGRTIRSACS